MSVNQMQRWPILKVVGLVGIAMLIALAAWRYQTVPSAPVGAKPITPAVIEAIVIHPIMKGVVLCAEHSAAQKMGLGDALGSDCLLAQQQEGMGTDAPVTLYRRDGKNNEDWFGWHAPLLAPFDGRVESVILNRVTNAAGRMGKSPATMIVFERADGVRVMYGYWRVSIGLVSQRRVGIG
jgi:hypothetical protein